MAFYGVLRQKELMSLTASKSSKTLFSILCFKLKSILTLSGTFVD